MKLHPIQSPILTKALFCSESHRCCFSLKSGAQTGKRHRFFFCSNNTSYFSDLCSVMRWTEVIRQRWMSLHIITRAASALVHANTAGTGSNDAGVSVLCVRQHFSFNVALQANRLRRESVARSSCSVPHLSASAAAHLHHIK